jgi:hypothetical protein
MSGKTIQAPFQLFKSKIVPLLQAFIDLLWKPYTSIYNSWSESASELYLPSDRRLFEKSLPTFADIGCHVVSVTDPYSRILDFLDRIRYFYIN